jgi:hypothetical protein
MSCTIYTMNCNFATHAICLLKFMTYKYNDLQVYVATQIELQGQLQNTFFFHNAHR